jgi:membrane-associated protease RseP (regulator of RpoE activity)
VATDGPAEKAGLVEGDRISAINGVSLRVASEDAGDGYMSSARMNRYRRELAKVSVGEDVELRVVSSGQSKTIRVKPVRAADLPRQRGGVMIIGDGAVSIGDIFPALPSITIPPTPMAPRAPRVFEFDGNLNDGIRMRIDPRARMEIEEQAQDAVRRAREAARDALERIERFRFDYDRRADESGSSETIVAPTPAPAPARARSGRIASAGATTAYGYATTPDVGYAAVAYTPEPVPTISTAGVAYAEPAVATTSRVATWDGDDAAFTLEGLRLARVNADLAENLGRGSERGFLVLDADRWSGLRAGDVLLEVDGRPVRSGTTARISLGAGSNHTAEVIRDGKQRVVSVDVR